MSNQVTLTLPDDLYENAQQWAVMIQRELPETLTDALRIVLTPMVTKPHLNNFIAVTVRRNWVSVGWHPPRK